MIAVLTVEEMRAVDAASPVPTEVLVDRAGAAVARGAARMLGGTYGRRVVVVAGTGNNGADGRVAADRLRRRGVRVAVFDAKAVPERIPTCDLVIDAAYGTGFHGTYEAPDVSGAPVLAVDVPSGVDGDTGAAGPHAVRADRTVTFAALKPGLLIGEGPAHAGEVEVADIGLSTRSATIHVVEDADVSDRIPASVRDAHKWHSGVCVIAGSEGMLGAGVLAARGALRAGAGTARLCVPGAAARDLPVSEVIGIALPAEQWVSEALSAAERFKACVIGPGIGRSTAAKDAVRRFVAEAPMPIVVDADGLSCIAGSDVTSIVTSRHAATVLTPHDGEFERLAGEPAGSDRIEAARKLARMTHAIVLLKGPTTVVASPGGECLVATAGDARLATAGTGDVLAGVVGAFLARGVPALQAAALGAHAHGAAARLGHRTGLLAGDLLDLLPAWLSSRGR